jgi:plasmid stability protein
VGSLLQIRDVPDAVRRALKARAAERGESLNSYLLRLLGRDVARPTTREVLERAAHRGERAQVSVVDALDAARRRRVDDLAGPPR